MATGFRSLIISLLLLTLVMTFFSLQVMPWFTEKYGLHFWGWGKSETLIDPDLTQLETIEYPLLQTNQPYNTPTQDTQESSQDMNEYEEYTKPNYVAPPAAAFKVARIKQFVPISGMAISDFDTVEE
jgi:hypothetical protein